MQNIEAFTRKAANYAKYRWDYAPEAVKTIFEVTGIGSEAVIADLGAGTGILTHHFAGRVQKIYAVEPNPAMRQEALLRLSGIPECEVIGAPAENTGLVGESIDLITVAQAVHWFHAEPARTEFIRILKPGGWLALLRNVSLDEPIFEDLQAINTPEYGVMPEHPAPSTNIPAAFYFADRSFQTLTYPFDVEQNMEQFIGAVLSTSFTPDETHPSYERFVQALREIFNHHHPNGKRLVSGETQLIIGQPRKPSSGTQDQ